MSKIKLIVSEVEGVLTDGKQPIDELDNTTFKNYYMPDFEAINCLKREVCPVVFMSTDNKINFNFFNRKQLPFFWAKKDKRGILIKIMQKYSVTADDTLYIGSKLSDIPCMNMIPLSFCVNEWLNSTIIGAGYSYEDLSSYPGEGIFTELYCRIKNGDVGC